MDTLIIVRSPIPGELSLENFLRAEGVSLVRPMTDEKEREKDRAWATLCRDSGWACRICGAVPERGLQFADNLCDDCRKMVRNE